jgi:hypothetical protein
MAERISYKVETLKATQLEGLLVDYYASTMCREQSVVISQVISLFVNADKAFKLDDFASYAMTKYLPTLPKDELSEFIAELEQFKKAYERRKTASGIRSVP